MPKLQKKVRAIAAALGGALAVVAGVALWELVERAWFAGNHRHHHNDIGYGLAGSALTLAWALWASRRTRRWYDSRLERTVEERTRLALEQQHRAEALLDEVRRSERTFRTLIERSPDAVLVHREGRVVFANRAAASMLAARSPEELAGEDIYEMLPPHEREIARTRVERAAAGEHVVPREFPFLRRDGTTGWGESVHLPVELDGAPALLLQVRDVTERRQIQGRLLLADRMASVGTLAAGVAHEINNPLSFVIANLEFVAAQLEAEGDPDVRQALAESRLGAERVREIVKDLKTFSRGDEDGTRSLVDVRDVVVRSIAMARSELRHRAVLIEELGETPLVDANAARLGQVFLNLLLNALQALPETDPTANVIRISTGADDAGGARVVIEDSGHGIPEAIRGRIFDPFFTTKPVGQGTGLGLSISHRIVTELAGEISFESRPGGGTTFVVTIPRSRLLHAAA